MSIVPFGDLSVSVDAIGAIVAAFLFSNPIDLWIWVSLLILATRFFRPPLALGLVGTLKGLFGWEEGRAERTVGE